MAKKHVNPALSTEKLTKYVDELLNHRAAVRSLTEDLKEETKARKQEIREHEVAIIELEQLIQGDDAEQSRIPGTEIPSVRSREGRRA
jgi:hypothetical protein